MRYYSLNEAVEALEHDLKISKDGASPLLQELTGKRRKGKSEDVRILLEKLFVDVFDVVKITRKSHVNGDFDCFR